MTRRAIAMIVTAFLAGCSDPSDRLDQAEIDAKRPQRQASVERSAPPRREEPDEEVVLAEPVPQDFVEETEGFDATPIDPATGIPATGEPAMGEPALGQAPQPQFGNETGEVIDAFD